MYSMRTFLTFVLAGASTLGVDTLAIAQENIPCSKVSRRTEMQTHAAVSEGTYVQTHAAEGAENYKKFVTYNDESGSLFLKYEFVKNDEEFIYEKSVNAAGKSKEERQRIILEFEDEIAFPGRETQINL